MDFDAFCVFTKIYEAFLFVSFGIAYYFDIPPFKGRIYDPCCGSSGMFVQSEKFV